jgi:hypothetical protein
MASPKKKATTTDVSSDKDFYAEWAEETLKRLERQAPLDCSKQHTLLAKIRAALATAGLEPMMALVGRATVMMVVEPPGAHAQTKTQPGTPKPSTPPSPSTKPPRGRR